MTTISLQPSQNAHSTTYNPRLPLPYPIHLGDDERCENVPGYPNRPDDRSALPILAGFQPDINTQIVTLHVEDFRADPEQAVGLVPVFFEPGGFAEGMFHLAVLITSVTVWAET